MLENGELPVASCNSKRSVSTSQSFWCKEHSLVFSQCCSDFLHLRRQVAQTWCSNLDLPPRLPKCTLFFSLVWQSSTWYFFNKREPFWLFCHQNLTQTKVWQFCVRTYSGRLLLKPPKVGNYWTRRILSPQRHGLLSCRAA